MRPKFPSQSIPITITDKVQTPEWSLSESVTSLDWIFHVPGDSVQREVVSHDLHATCKQLLDSVFVISGIRRYTRRRLITLTKTLTGLD